ncbi:HAD-IA family hydrolase [bacterium]|nr:MAG: HAD-IA family hydrolase [bacterium]
MNQPMQAALTIPQVIEQAPTFEQKNIVFDMTGVLFEFHMSKFLLLRKIGIMRLLAYSIWHYKNPFNLLNITLDFLDKISPPTNNKFYKTRKLPQLTYEWGIGKKTSAEIKAEINQALEKNPTLIRSNLEHSVILATINDLLCPQSFANACKPTALVEMVQFLRNQHNADGSRKHHLYLLSNFDAESFAILKTQHPKLFACFDGLVVSGTAGCMKPDDEIFDYLFNTYQLKPQECLFIDDQEENTTAGNKHGMKTILLLGSH